MTPRLHPGQQVPAAAAPASAAPPPASNGQLTKNQKKKLKRRAKARAADGPGAPQLEDVPEGAPLQSAMSAEATEQPGVNGACGTGQEQRDGTAQQPIDVPRMSLQAGLCQAIAFEILYEAIIARSGKPTACITVVTCICTH